MRAMVFIDFENFNISYCNRYKNKNLPLPKLDYNLLPIEIVKLLSHPHELIKTFLFAPKPDDFLMQDEKRKNTYDWVNGLKNQNYFDVIEGVHIARPVSGYTKSTMDIANPRTYYVQEKGTDVNLAINVINKGLHNAFDTAIIVSGDTDYSPVMKLLSDIGKTVVAVGVKGQSLYKFKTCSDEQIILDEAFFQKCIRTK